MAFFKLTMVGSQNKLQEEKIEGASVNEQDKLEEQLKQEFASQQINEYGNGPSGSYTKHSLIRQKHIRNPKGTRKYLFQNFKHFFFIFIILKAPKEIYKNSITTSQDVGWWAESEPIEKTLPWTHVKKHVFPKSEMTA